MSTQFDQRNPNQNQNADMYPTNSQAGGPGALGSEPGRNVPSDQGRHFDNDNNNYAGQQQSQSQHLQQQQDLPAPPSHPDRRSDQNGQSGQGAGIPGTRSGQGGYDQYGGGKQDDEQYARQNLNQDQEQTPSQPHTLDRRGHRAPGARAAAETGAAYEVGKHTNATGTGTGPGQHHSLNEHGANIPGVPGQNRQGQGAEVGPGQHDQSASDQGQHHGGPGTGVGKGTGAGTGHHAGGPVGAAEAGAVYEGGKLASGAGTAGHHQNHQGHATGVGPGQHDQYASGQTQHSGVPGTGTGGVGTGTGTGHHTGGPVRAAEAGAAYEGGKLAHGAGAGTGTGTGTGLGTGGQHAGQQTAHPAGTGAFDAGAGANAPGYGSGHPGAGTGAAAHPGAGAYDGQQTTAGYGTGTGTGPGVGAGAGVGAPGVHPGQTGAASGRPAGVNMPGLDQAQVVLGKLQQAGGKVLKDESMRSKGLEREAKGVAKVDQREAQRLEDMANARREKAGGIHAGGGPGAANAGVDPTAGTHGRNL